MIVLTACSGSWDITNFGTVKYETNTYEIYEEFESISMKTDTADIVFAPSDDEVCRVVCYEEKNIKHSAVVADGALSIDAVDTRKWYEHISIGFESAKITVYLPKSEYSSLCIEESTGDIEIPNDFRFESIDLSLSTGDVLCRASVAKAVKISLSTGDVRVEGISAESLAISVSTGDVTASDIKCAGDVSISVSTGRSYLTDIACKSVISNGSTGEIFMTRVIASEKFSVWRSTGDVSFDGCDASEISVTTDTGDVSGTLLSDKVFITTTDTGDIEVPNSVSGGRCEITTDTGDIRISVGK